MTKDMENEIVDEYFLILFLLLRSLKKKESIKNLFESMYYYFLHLLLFLITQDSILESIIFIDFQSIHYLL